MAQSDAAEQLNGLAHERQDTYHLGINMKILEAELPSRPAISHCRHKHSKSRSSRAAGSLAFEDLIERSTAARSIRVDTWATY